MDVKTGAHTIEVTITHENGQPDTITLRTASPGAAYGLGDHGGWEPNANAATSQSAIRKFLDNDYRIRWAVTGSGFWQAQGTGLSFGLYDLTKFPETKAPLPPDFGDWCKALGIRWMIGQRTNFVPLGGPHSSQPGQSGATTFDTSPHSQTGLDRGYFHQ